MDCTRRHKVEQEVDRQRQKVIIIAGRWGWLATGGPEKEPFEPDQDNRRTGGYACVGKRLTTPESQAGSKADRFLRKRFFYYKQGI
jgi:hypothetical protein